MGTEFLFWNDESFLELMVMMLEYLCSFARSPHIVYFETVNFIVQSLFINKNAVKEDILAK
jgi:hypothetical protein